MSLDDVKALTFDTGGTILDWHTGFRTALAEAGAGYGIEKDWAALANELRRRSMKRKLRIVNEAQMNVSRSRGRMAGKSGQHSSPCTVSHHIFRQSAAVSASQPLSART